MADVDGNSSNLLLTANTGRYSVFPNNSIPNSTRKVNAPEEIPALKAESSGMNGEVPPVPALENMQATSGGKDSKVRSNTLKHSGINITDELASEYLDESRFTYREITEKESAQNAIKRKSTELNEAPFLVGHST